VFLLALPGNAQERRQVPTSLIRFDAGKGTLSVQAPGLQLSEVLRLLQVQHGIRVTVVDLQDRKVEVDLHEQPLYEALQALLGEGVRYLLDFDRDVELPPPPSQPQQRRPGAEPGPVLPEMPPAPVPRQGLPRKGEVQEAAGGARIPPAGKIEALPVEGEPQTQSPSEADESKSHAVLLLRLRKGAAPTVERIIEQPGELVMPARLQGDWLWEVEVAGKRIAVGSQHDPHEVIPICAERPRDPRARLVRREDADVVVGLAVPGELLDPALRRQATIRFKRLGDALELPVEFGLETFAAFAARSQDLMALDSRALSAARVDRR
jgi:hypothetical protein